MSSVSDTFGLRARASFYLAYVVGKKSVAATGSSSDQVFSRKLTGILERTWQNSSRA